MSRGSRRPTARTPGWPRRAQRFAGRFALGMVLVVVASCSNTGGTTGGEVFRVEIEACAGISHQRATAMAVGPDLVATAAHTFESARGAVLRTVDGDERSAEIVYLDLERDVALLSTETRNDRVFTFADAEDDTDVTIPTFAEADGVETKTATVLRSVTATLDGTGRRRAVELSASIDQGDSGAPVVNDDGRAVGMVFASSRRADRGWAVAASELTEAIDAVTVDDNDPPPSRCRS